MKIAILTCTDCGTELNRSHPFKPEEEGTIRLTSGLVAGKCPKGCRSTFSDLNLNTDLEIVDFVTPEELNGMTDDEILDLIKRTPT